MCVCVCVCVCVQVGLQVGNTEREREMKQEQEKLEKRIGLLNYLVDKDSKYCQSPQSYIHCSTYYS